MLFFSFFLNMNPAPNIYHEENFKKFKTVWSQLTEEISGLLGFTHDCWSHTKLVLCHDSKLISVVFCQSGHHVGALLGVVRDVDPGFSVVFAFLYHIVGDLGSAVIKGRVPSQTDPFRKHLGELHRPHRWTRWS